MSSPRITEAGDTRVTEDGLDTRVVPSTEVASVAFSGAGTINYSALSIPGSFSSTAFSGAGSVSMTGNKVLLVSATLSGAGTTSFDNTSTLFGFAGVLVEGIDYIRVTTGEDTRVTESGADIRVTSEVGGFTGFGSITGSATRVPFSSTPQVKHEGTWKTFVPYVKYEGEWCVPRYIYYKQSGSWTRAY